MKTYDIVKRILLSDPVSRNSDKHYQGLDISSYYDWEKAAHPKSIIEARRNLQRDQEERMENGEVIPLTEIVVADKKFQKLRRQLEEEKGTHIFREDVQVKLI